MSDFLSTIRTTYGDEIADAVLAETQARDFDSLYAALESVCIRRDRPRLASLDALRWQHCTSSVEREDQTRDVTTEQINDLSEARRRFRV